MYAYHCTHWPTAPQARTHSTARTAPHPRTHSTARRRTVATCNQRLRLSRQIHFRFHLLLTEIWQKRELDLIFMSFTAIPLTSLYYCTLIPHFQVVYCTIINLTLLLHFVTALSVFTALHYCTFIAALSGCLPQFNWTHFITALSLPNFQVLYHTSINRTLYRTFRLFIALPLISLPYHTSHFQFVYRTSLPHFQVFYHTSIKLTSLLHFQCLPHFIAALSLLHFQVVYRTSINLTLLLYFQVVYFTSLPHFQVVYRNSIRHSITALSLPHFQVVYRTSINCTL